MQADHGVDLHKFNLYEAWNHDVFTDFRKKITHPRYTGCKEFNFKYLLILNSVIKFHIYNFHIPIIYLK
ncbi:MAG: hypothetical protein BAJALOKI3v1_140056 [Promethearchaeota archaeon]|nr:MAG: hypothetical protein BAJALOKI3v1_140056 [Candidatus Lokiarchaeota archaeon]